MTIQRKKYINTRIYAQWNGPSETEPNPVLQDVFLNFLPFRLLWPWPWPDDLRIRTWPVDRGDMPHVQTWTSYGKVFESYSMTDIRDTDRQTYIYAYKTKIIYHAAALRVVKLVNRQKLTLLDNTKTIRRRCGWRCCNSDEFWLTISITVADGPWYRPRNRRRVQITQLHWLPVRQPL